jgi:hypothetical protein
MVDQTAGRRDHHIDAARHAFDLRPVFGAAHHNSTGNTHVAAIGPDAFADLNGKLAGRRQNKRAAGFRRGPSARFENVLENRQRESRSLAGTGLGNAQNVAAIHQRGNGARLNGRGFAISFIPEGTKEGLGQAEGRKFSQSNSFKQSRRGRAPYGGALAQLPIFWEKPRVLGLAGAFSHKALNRQGPGGPLTRLERLRCGRTMRTAFRQSKGGFSLGGPGTCRIQGTHWTGAARTST